MTSPTEQRRGFERIKGIEKFAFVMAIGSMALTGCAVAEAQPPVTTPSSSSTEVATPTPTETESVAPELEFTVQALEIPTSTAPEQLPQKFLDDLVAYYNANENQTTVDALIKSPLSPKDFGIEQAKVDRTVFVDALFPDSFSNNANLVGLANGTQQIRAYALANWLHTVTGNEANTYKVSFSAPTNVVTKPGATSGSIEVTFSATGIDNGAKNTIGSTSWNSGIPDVYDVTFAPEGEVYHLTNFVMNNGK